MTDQDGSILDVKSGFRGPEADQNVYRATPLSPDLSNKVKLGDNGYVGTDIEMPTKKPKGGALTSDQGKPTVAFAQNAFVSNMRFDVSRHFELPAMNFVSDLGCSRQPFPPKPG